MFSRALAILYVTMPLAAGLWISKTQSDWQVNASNPKYGYVIMWVDKRNIPQDIQLTQKIMTREQELTEVNSMKEQGSFQSTVAIALKALHDFVFGEESLSDVQDEVPSSEGKQHKHQKHHKHHFNQKVAEEALSADSLSPDSKLRLKKLEESLSPEANLISKKATAKWTSDAYRAALNRADELRDLGSKYPLVIVTNHPNLIAIKTDKNLQAMYPNVVIKEINHNDWLPHQCSMASGHSTHYQKVSIFGMTEYDKLLWMDMDVKVQKNLDSVLEDPNYDVEDGKKVWGQMDNWVCNDKTALKNFCSGMMLFKPTSYHVEGLNAQARNQKWCWGDQKLISSYFTKQDRSVGLLPRDVISWAHCGSRRSMASHAQDGGK